MIARRFSHDKKAMHTISIIIIHSDMQFECKRSKIYTVRIIIDKRKRFETGIRHMVVCVCSRVGCVLDDSLVSCFDVYKRLDTVSTVNNTIKDSCV